MPGDTTYQLKADGCSPFLKRNLTTFPDDGKTKAKFLLIKEKYYELFYANEKTSYSARSQKESKKRGTVKNPVFSNQEDLKGNPKQISYSIEKLCQWIVSDFKENPQNLFPEANRIAVVCREINFEIPRIRAFDGIENWDAFIQLLDSIVLHRSPDQFELLLAAISQYARRCGNI